MSEPVLDENGMLTFKLTVGQVRVVVAALSAVDLVAPDASPYRGRVRDVQRIFEGGLAHATVLHPGQAL